MTATRAWGIKQKQTGADRLTLGGAVSANIHGRGLAYAPFVEDIEALDDAGGRLGRSTCSRMRELRAVPARRRRLRPVRRHHLGEAAPGAAAEGRARRRAAATSSEIVAGFEERIRDGLSVRRLPVLDRAGRSRIPVARRVLLLSAGRIRVRRFPTGRSACRRPTGGAFCISPIATSCRAFHEFTDFYLRSTGRSTGATRIS